jgi:hypothetical protein
VELESGAEQFTVDDLYALSELVAAAWTAGADRDWSVPAGTVEWSCTKTADHAVDCVYAPAFFLASRKQDAYPDAGSDLTLGANATPERLVESLHLATRLLAAVVNDASPSIRAAIFQGPEVVIASPPDFVPRGALELILHAHDVCTGVRVPFEPPPALCARMREHTRPWPVWWFMGPGLSQTDDPWGDLLIASGRARQE